MFKANKKKLIISFLAFVLLLSLYWALFSAIDAFFHCQVFDSVSWFKAWKKINNFLSALVLSFASVLCYLIFLGWLHVKNTKSNKVISQKGKQDAIKEFKKIDKDKIIFLNQKFGLVANTLKQHTLLVGGSGYGKTTTLLTIINQLKTKFGQKTIIIDGKGDQDLIEKVLRLDQNAYIWSIGGKQSYNPLATKNNVILSDKIMSLFNFSEPHYQVISHNYLLFLIKVMLENEVAITLENIIAFFPVSKLKKLIKDKGSLDYELLLSIAPREQDIAGLQHRLNLYWQQLETSVGDHNSLVELTNKYDTILFSLNSFKYPELAANFGKLLIQDLKEFATIKPQEQTINLILDEFNVFVTDAVVNLINKSRSFNFQCFLSFQTIRDLELKNKNITDVIFANGANVIAHKIKDPNTAEYVAKVFGTRTEKKLTKQYDLESHTGKGSIREVEEYNVHPNQLKQLKTGEVFCQVLLPSARHLIEKILVDLV